MVKRFDSKKQYRITFYDEVSERVRERYVCPDCMNHKQIHEERGKDCLNLFKRGHNVSGQCGCYSNDH